MSDSTSPEISLPRHSDGAANDQRAALAEMKALAEEGRDAPLINGVMNVLWGGVIGVAALISFLNISGVIKLNTMGSYLIWIVAFVIGWVLSFVYGPKTSRKRGAATIGNRTASAVWFSVGIAMTGTWFLLMFLHDDFTHIGVPPYFLFQMMFPLSFLLYGVALFATATAARTPWLNWFAVAAWAFAGAAFMLMGSGYQMLLAVAGSFICSVLPGLILMRGESQESHSSL